MAAPALVQLEANTLDWLRDWMGFPETTRGLFTDRRLDGDVQRACSAPASATSAPTSGAACSTPPTRRITRCSSRRSSPASCPIACAGWRATRTTGCRSDDLRAAIAADRAAGLTPFAVVSSAGTTNTGAVDPLDAVADLCATEGLWHHVDGAYGAFFQLDPDAAATSCSGLSRADSLTLDPHKGMFLPYGTGALLVRDGAALRAAHEATADYLPAMPHPDDFYDPSQHGPDLSRGFPGLRVWLCVKLFGAAAFRDAIAEKRRLTLEAFARIAALPGIVIDAPPDLSLFAFHVSWPGATLADEDAATRALMAGVTARGRVMVTGAVARGRYLGRVCVLSFRTHAAEIDALVEDMTGALPRSSAAARCNRAQRWSRKVPARSSANARRISSCVFITTGPYHAIGSRIGAPDTSRKRMPCSPARTRISSPASNTVSERLATSVP